MSAFSTSRSFFSLSLNPQPLLIGAEDGRVQRSGTWMETRAEGAVGQAYLSSSGSAADTLTFAFSGTAAEVVYLAGPNYGSFIIEVDGVPVQQVNASAAQLSVGNLALVSGLSAGEHTLRILPLAGATVAIDAVIVDGQALSVSVPQPTPSPTIQIPTLGVTDEVTVEPSATATVEATVAPTDMPTVEPTDVPTVEATETVIVESTTETTSEVTVTP